MRTQEIERLIAEHFRAEVSGAVAEPTATKVFNRRRLVTSAATAVLALLPALMVITGPTLDPLASDIDRGWSDGGRDRVAQILLSAVDAIDIQGKDQEE